MEEVQMSALGSRVNGEGQVSISAVVIRVQS